MATPYPAIGDPRPVWPLPGVESRGKPKPGGSFGAPRGPKKWHAGVDLGAPEGSLVVAMEPGRIVKIVRGWANIYDPKTGDLIGGDTARVLVEGDSGLVINYAALGIDSWLEFDRKVGDELEQGDPIGRVGRYPGGDSMLHLETYRSGTRDNQRWLRDREPPPELLDPTEYVERSKAEDSIELEPLDVRPLPRPTPPAPPPRPVPASAGAGLVVLLILGAYALSR